MKLSRQDHVALACFALRRQILESERAESAAFFELHSQLADEEYAQLSARILATCGVSPAAVDLDTGEICGEP